MYLTLLAGIVIAVAAHAEIEVRDDTGQLVRLAAPARRIVSLAPHITENLYSAGAGGRIVGAVEFSDFPEAAKRLPRVGGYERLDIETILALKPDLIVAWHSGNMPVHLARLKALGLPLYIDQPQRIDDIASSIERFGELAGSTQVARKAAQAFRNRHAALRMRYAGQSPVRTFYQIWNQPLMTINGEQIIGDVMRLCGAENVFAGLPQLAPVVTVEAVLAANPEAIVASGMGDARPEWLDSWRRWRELPAIARDNLFFVPADFIDRHSTRLLDGAQRLCEHMEAARGKRSRSVSQ